MAAKTTNGTGGGNWSAGATWTGGVAAGEGDTVIIATGDTLTIDGNVTVGADSATAAIASQTTGKLSWQAGATAILILKGDMTCNRDFNGTADVTKTLTIKLNYSAALAAGKYGIVDANGTTVINRGFDRGRVCDVIASNCASGQKVVVTTADNSAKWQVGDTIVVGSVSTNAAGGAEERIIQSIAGTSVTMTVNFTYTHEAGQACDNLTSNIIITNYNDTYQGYWSTANQTAGNLDNDYLKLLNIGYNAVNKYGVTYTAASVGRGTWDNMIIQNVYGMYFNSDTGKQSYSNWALYKSAGLGMAYMGGTSVFNTIHAIACTGGINYYSIFKTTFNNLITSNGNYMIFRYLNYLGGTCRFSTVTSLTLGMGIICYADVEAVDNNTTIYFDKCSYGIDMQTAGVVRFTNVNFGTVAANSTSDIRIANTYSLIITNSNTLTPSITNNTNSWSVGKISIRDTTNAHKTYTPYGNYIKQSTTKRTASTNAVQFSPVDASNEIYKPVMRIPGTSGKICSYTFYLRKDAAMTALPYITLSGLGMTSMTATMTNSTDTWEALTVYGLPTESGFADIYVGVKNGSGNVYLDDDFDSYNLWYQGDLPTTVPKPSLTANDVWSVDLDAFTTGSLAGNKLRQNNANLKSML